MAIRRPRKMWISSSARSDLDRFTQVARNSASRLPAKRRPAGTALTHDDVEINVVPEGGKARTTAPTSVPSPTKLGVPTGLDYADLPGWMELKLSSGRQKDRAHIVEVMKVADDEVIRQAREVRLQLIDMAYLSPFRSALGRCGFAEREAGA